MASIQDTRSKILKAARLRKIQEATDLVLPMEEAEKLNQVIHSKNLWTPRIHPNSPEKCADPKVIPKETGLGAISLLLGAGKGGQLSDEKVRKSSSFRCEDYEDLNKSFDGGDDETQDDYDAKLSEAEKSLNAHFDDDALSLEGGSFIAGKYKKTSLNVQEFDPAVKPKQEGGIFGKRKPKCYSKVVAARRRAQLVKNEVQFLETDEDKEIFLMKSFLLEHLHGFQHAIGARYLFREGRFDGGSGKKLGVP
jgi:hypothetical protein